MDCKVLLGLGAYLLPAYVFIDNVERDIII